MNFRLDVHCPDCAEPPALVVEMTSPSNRRATSAMVHCPACGGRWQVHVRLLGSAERRFPWPPLADVVAARIGTDAGTDRVASYLGIHPATAFRWATEGIPLRRADECAAAAGLNPVTIWPDFHADLSDLADSTAA